MPDRPLSCVIDPAERRALCDALVRLEQAQSAGRPWAQAEAHLDAARAYRRVGALPSALTLLEQALTWARVTGARDQAVDLQCEIVETLALQATSPDRDQVGIARAARERARDLVFDASRQATRVADAQWEVTVLLRLSDVLDRFGDRDDATLLQVRALQLTVGAALGAPAQTAADAALLRCH
jgi:hypothetical protein